MPNPLEVSIPLRIEDESPIKIKVEQGGSVPQNIVHIDTEENWNSKPTTIGKKGHVYVYSDHDILDGQLIPALKVGDGMAYLIDMPFVDSSIYHIKDGTIHVTAEDKEFWNNKVRCYMGMNVHDAEELLVFTTD